MQPTATTEYSKRSERVQSALDAGDLGDINQTVVLLGSEELIREDYFTTDFQRKFPNGAATFSSLVNPPVNPAPKLVRSLSADFTPPHQPVPQQQGSMVLDLLRASPTFAVPIAIIAPAARTPAARTPATGKVPDESTESSLTKFDYVSGVSMYRPVAVMESVSIYPVTNSSCIMMTPKFNTLVRRDASFKDAQLPVNSFNTAFKNAMTAAEVSGSDLSSTPSPLRHAAALLLHGSFNSLDLEGNSRRKRHGSTTKVVAWNDLAQIHSAEFVKSTDGKTPTTTPEHKAVVLDLNGKIPECSFRLEL